jgi:hypothetical protein
MCDTCNKNNCSCDKLYSSGVMFDGAKFICNEGQTHHFTIKPCDNLNTVLSTFADQICQLWSASSGFNYVQTVALNVNSLDFTGVGLGFTGSIDLSAYVNTNDIDYISTVALNVNSLDFTGIGNGFNGSIDLSAYVNQIDYISNVVLSSNSLDFTGVGNGFNGSVNLNNLRLSKTTHKSANYTAVVGDFILMTTGATDKTITLPLAASNLDGIINIKKIDNGAGHVIIDGNGAETIDGESTQVMISQWTNITIQSDGTSWFIK